MQASRPIGIFDSGFGGLTVFKSIKDRLPQYDYIYLGDNARAPYGDLPFETVYQYTLEAVRYLFAKGCPLIILACNTASAKALRQIQQKDLSELGPDKRVLGVIRPSAEEINNYTQSKHVGIVGTKGTIQSNSYILEIHKTFPDIKVYQQACPTWVPMIENNEADTPEAAAQIKSDLQLLLQQSDKIDTVLLGCTHYPLIMDQIKQYLPEDIKVLAQGDIVAEKIAEYLQRHPDKEMAISKNGTTGYYTTGEADSFNKTAITFLGEEVAAKHVDIT